MFYGRSDGHVTDELLKEVKRRFDHAAASDPSSLSQDGKGVMVAQGLGYTAFVTPEGEAFLEEYELDGSEGVTVDRSARGHAQALLLAKKRFPEIVELLPTRPPHAPNCRDCESGLRSVGPMEFFCKTCFGLGWVQLEPSHQ